MLLAWAAQASAVEPAPPPAPIPTNGAATAPAHSPVQASAPALWRWENLQGEFHTGVVEAITGDGIIHVRETAADPAQAPRMNLASDDLRILERVEPNKSAAPGAGTGINTHMGRLFLVGGGLAVGESVTIHGRLCQWRRMDAVMGSVPGGGVPLGMVRGVLLEAPKTAAGKPGAPAATGGPDQERRAEESRFAALLSAPSPGGATSSGGTSGGMASGGGGGGGGTQDQLLVRTRQGLQAVAGTLEELTPQQVKFTWEGQTRTVARERVVGIVLAPAPPPPTLPTPALANPSVMITPAPAARMRVRLSDGSVWAGQSLTLEKGSLHLTWGGAQIPLTWGRVTQVEFISPRLAWLSALEPVRVVEEFFPSAGWHWQRDRAVTGAPLQLAGKTYDRGLGVHARTVLQYELAQGYDQFLATIGLQEDAGATGPVVFIVYGDGVELFRQEVRGPGETASVNVNVAGVHRLSLEVTPAPGPGSYANPNVPTTAQTRAMGLDMGTYADWADARLLRAAGR